MLTQQGRSCRLNERGNDSLFRNGKSSTDDAYVWQSFCGALECKRLARVLIVLAANDSTYCLPWAMLVRASSMPCYPSA
jgi:hypothetical protein